MEHITLTTADGKHLAADWYSVDAPRGWVLLLHMMPATKESYRELAAELQRVGIASLAFDQRGHGASTGGPDGYASFSNAEQQEKREDVRAAIAFLHERGMTSEHLVVVGASIGANLALDALTGDLAIPAAVLLSPGHIYHGISADALAGAVAPHQRVYLVAGGANDAYSTETIAALGETLADRATVRVLDDASHGTEMFNRDAALLPDVVAWIAAQV
ncbi:MAG: alpha/beta fold hydrolase [bacterium]|nr:alpha/beta fold hydrolase [bacterium]